MFHNKDEYFFFVVFLPDGRVLRHKNTSFNGQTLWQASLFGSNNHILDIKVSGYAKFFTTFGERLADVKHSIKLLGNISVPAMNLTCYVITLEEQIKISPSRFTLIAPLYKEALIKDIKANSSEYEIWTKDVFTTFKDIEGGTQWATHSKL